VPRLPRARTAAIALPFALAVLWAHVPTLAALAERWAHDPQYSHGFLVPLFAAVVLWVRRPRGGTLKFEPSWWGLPWLAGGALLRLASAALYLEWLDAVSLLPTLAGLCVLFGGPATLRWAWPAVAFLAFMLPMPFQVEVALAVPLRRVATLASTYLLQTFGLPAVAEGNVILIGDVKLGVVEACSGLGMLMTFFALSTAVALVLPRGRVDRLVIFLSAVPIALVANITRITATGVLYVTAGGGVARVVYHDLAGWLMMPLALLLLWLELKLLANLFLAPEPTGPLPLGEPPRAPRAAVAGGPAAVGAEVPVSQTTT
jgi:exosortase